LIPNHIGFHKKIAKKENMIKNSMLLLLICAFFCSCQKDNDDELDAESAKVALTFSHHWDDTIVETSDFNTIQYQNENGEQMSVERLRYLVSNFTFERSDGETISINGYNLVDLTKGTGLSDALPDSIPIGNYTNVSFIFGFDNEDNLDGAYPDLNSVLWNVPEMLGGGYHYMQLEGKFVDSTETETGYQYHAIRAVDTSGENLVFEDTFFTVDLGAIEIGESTSIEINMNIAEWFKNPVRWDLNELHSMMMPNFEAQKMISQNGKSVFSLGEVTIQ